jgi:hypothetical protein
MCWIDAATWLIGVEVLDDAMRKVVNFCQLRRRCVRPAHRSIGYGVRDRHHAVNVKPAVLVG